MVKKGAKNVIKAQTIKNEFYEGENGDNAAWVRENELRKMSPHPSSLKHTR